MHFNILIPILSICFNVLAQVLLCKFIVKKSLLKTVYFGFIGGLLILIVCEYSVYCTSVVDWLPLMAVNLIIYGCLSFSYFTFINMGETARRIRLLRELYYSPGGLTNEQILDKYSSREIIGVRMNRLLGNGQVILRNGSYFIGSPVMLLFSGIIVFMKLLISGKKSEFDK